MPTSRITGVITAYHPDKSLRDVAAAALGSCGHVIVVDNTPQGEPSKARALLSELANVELVRFDRNIGLAAALNLSIAQTDSEFVFLLDQDSAPDSTLGLALLKVIDQFPHCGAIGPAPWDSKENRFIDPRAEGRSDISSLPVIITSAMLLRRSAFNMTKGFREEFFVDCVDQDFCLQLRSNGWSVFQDKRLTLPHSLGNTRWHNLGPLKLRATHHPTWRLYWVARNGVILNREFLKSEFCWVVSNTLILCYWLLTIILFEPPRIKKISAFTVGLWHGLTKQIASQYVPTGARLS